MNPRKNKIASPKGGVKQAPNPIKKSRPKGLGRVKAPKLTSKPKAY